MKLVPTEEERDLRDSLRGLLADHCPIGVVRGLREPGADRFPQALWEALARAEVFALPFPEDVGGVGGGLPELGVLAVECGRVLCPSVVRSTIGFGLAVDLLGDDALRGRLLPALCRGELRGTVALADPWDASNVRPVLLAERLPADRWQIRGAVPFVADADLADLVVVTAIASDGTWLAAFVRPGDGVELEPMPTTAGDRFSRLQIDVEVGPDDVLVSPAQADLLAVSLRLRALQCAEMVGGAEAVIDRTVDYTCGREQFGRPIASFQAAQHLVADLHIAVQAARLSSLSALAALATGEAAVRPTAIAVMHTAPAYRRATLDAHQLHGGMGYVIETDLHLWSEHARELGALGGNADVATRWLEREVCGA